MRDHKPRSKLVLNEATDGSTRVVDEVGPSSRVYETTTSGQSHPSQALRMPQRSGRVVLQPNRYLGLTETQVFIQDDGVEDPSSYKQAMNDVNKDQWVKAMDLEMKSMEGVDCEETFFPVAMLKSIRILLSIATFYDYELWKMDVKTAFLNDNLEKSIFMSQLEGFITQGQEQKARHLYAVGIVSRYQSKPGFDHWTAVKIILKYLKRTRDYMLVYGEKDLILIGYTDSDFQIDKDFRKSTSGSVFTLNERVVVWRCIKQGCIVDSIMEVEYVDACEAAKEAVWLRKFLHDLEVVPNMNLPITLYCDNSGAVANSKEPRNHKRGKHIERKYHLIREIVQRGDMIVTKIASEHNIVDPFTKTLTAKVFEGHLESLGPRDMYIR
ncbi:retrovirus-related pol polyprotein from transposon tnt 1-94 [Cucumis melo var. makuwa]|uniref:Retrovirus-related pol polyprotein from transposon tnt 1-94 n=1 Tax=Cucumis melo var. makuwa TaxID=1194695 RepID=A0A5D3CKN7_CUCMM|nr:retrovirus-related pol polyprotein from transposon tnt 1-94 [Cucumis melo var. makuwa]